MNPIDLVALLIVGFIAYLIVYAMWHKAAHPIDPSVCRRCHGQGRYTTLMDEVPPGRWVDCRYCGGTGRTTKR
jgi:hypothetical protein